MDRLGIGRVDCVVVVSVDGASLTAGLALLTAAPAEGLYQKERTDGHEHGHSPDDSSSDGADAVGPESGGCRIGRPHVDLLDAGGIVGGR